MTDASDEPIPPTLIEDALERVLASRRFRGSARKRRFLKFVVEQTQAGHADRIKAFTIAIDVFDRDANFDPLLDPVVRIQAGRIRRCLEQYYLSEGAEDPLQITIPKGGYVPHFHMKQGGAAVGGSDLPAEGERPDIVDENPVPTPADAAQAPAPLPTSRPFLPLGIGGEADRQTVVVGGVLAFLLVLLFVSAWFAVDPSPSGKGEKYSSAIRGPSIMVQPFANNTGKAAQDVFVQGFTDDLISALIQFKSVFVFGTEAALHSGSEPEPRKAVPDAGPDYFLKGSVSQAGERMQVNATLLGAKDQRYIWSKSYRSDFTASNMIDVRQDIAVQVARALAQSNGVIHTEEMQAASRQTPSLMSSYECMLKTRHYWRQLNRDMHVQVRTCLENAIKTDPRYADVWAALSLVYLDESWLGFNPGKARPDPVATGLQLATHAVTLAPDNSLPHQALGRAYWLRREPERSIAAYEQALALNPYDSDILAELGRCYSLIGDWEKGIPLLGEAFARNPAHPNWYRIIFALHHYVHGRYDEALEEAKRIDLQNGVLPHVALAMIYGQMGRATDAADEVGEILRLEPKFGEKAIAEFERRNIDRAIIDKVVDGLRKAGLAISPQWASSDGR